MPRPPGALSLSLPRLPRPRPPRPTDPAVAVPSAGSAIGRFFSRVTSREFWALTGEDGAGTGRDYARFAVLLGCFSIVALATLVVVLLASLFSQDNAEAPGPLDSPSPTTRTSTPTAPGSLTDSPWIDAQLLEDDPLAVADILWDTAQSIGAYELGPAANHIRQAVADGNLPNANFICPFLDHYNADYASGPVGSPACDDALVAPPPEGDISLGIWANELNAWWFGKMPEGAAAYSEGDEAPFLLTWAATPGAEYSVAITYTCSVDGVPAIDILSGVQSADEEIFEADWGPGDPVPDAAVFLPDTPDLGIDDGSVRLLYLFGGDFLLLPQGPDPADGCDGERTIAVPIRADADTDEMILMGSVWLADASDHDGRGAADAAAIISLSASVSAVGTVAAGIEPGVITP